jgi:hypothetical protein
MVVAEVLALAVVVRLAQQAILLADGVPVADLAVGDALHGGLAPHQQGGDQYQGKQADSSFHGSEE